MPEGPEIETERLHEAIHEELEKEESGFLRTIAVTTAVLAALAAIASLRAGATVNEALVKKAEATRLQAEASDQWAFFQAKGLKAAVQEAAAASWAAAGKEAPGALAEKVERYGKEQKEIEAKARELEKERDAASVEADHLLHDHERFATSVAFLQVAIALGAVAALTRRRLVWLGSLAVGACGLLLAALALLG
jgi:replicative superfamily II helicase